MSTPNRISSISLHKEKIKGLFQAAISIDCVVFGYDNPSLKILALQSELEPYAGLYSLVGDLVQPDETLEHAAQRILLERTGLKEVKLEQVKTFGKPDRHPLGRVISTAFFALVNSHDYKVDPKIGLHPKWTSIEQMDEMAFDHKEILHESLKIVRRRFFSDALYAELLPPVFTLSQLQYLSEAVLNKKFDKRNFRKKMLNSEYIEETAERQINVSHRPARLYKVNRELVENNKQN